MGKLMLDGVEVGLPDRTVTAGGVSYDNTLSGLSATEVQSAIDEVANSIVSVTAGGVSFDPTITGDLPASVTNVQDAIDAITMGTRVSVFGNGVKTYGQLLAELQALIDYSKINPKSVLDIDHGWYSIEFAYNRILESYRVRSGGSATMVFEIYLADNECTYKGRNAESGTTTNYSNATVANGAIFSLIY